ncbi:hypothetical protein ABB37_05659 [Leptomonas pyrrhocoris]|uniref:Transmembrane protein n=1 Tax=Leptomonas pyrrhocoris TaxID=157538 RepID=A0A0N0DUW0_LEPPY|nr:hypothetical protein ABB37_05659 [Leptomonas pyrrhocoris]XP_015657593.1 hypothetical protein ABB37_05659 [Leptomonas pyrrhocoris]KPA79153.1 hypothetical protein ABB37_05659 [Leptomonas pyrrhocoris]KPA79154.1 hypothetical protein ABB37_05659 [Leptomonas pyrrhocoris]|eukprot:XP_015657592.1 hypothetical protein ABB37_05659 [Leptomonas pyrrhocoris]
MMVPPVVGVQHDQTTSTTIAAEVGGPTTSTSTTAAPATWTMDAAMMWVVAAFYLAVMATAATYFVKRWRRRAYGPGSAAGARSGTGGREERAALTGGGSGGAGSDGAGGEAGFLATIGSIIDRVMNRAALDGAAAFKGSGRHRSSSPGHRYKPGAGHALLRRIAPFLPGAQGRAAAARRNKEKDEAAEEAVEVEAGNAGGGVRSDASPTRNVAAVASPLNGGVGEGGPVPPGGMPATMTARDLGH